MEIFDVTFPSPVVTPHEANNTVHCEYFSRRSDGKRPAVIVLHILGGDFALSRLFCHALAQQRRGGAVREDAVLRSSRASRAAARMVTADPERPSPA